MLFEAGEGTPQHTHETVARAPKSVPRTGNANTYREPLALATLSNFKIDARFLLHVIPARER